MPKLMLVGGTRQNSTSNCHNHHNVGVLTFCVVFATACLSFSNALPYKTILNDFNWTRYVAPSPIKMGQYPYIEYGDDDYSVEDGIIEEDPEKETKKVSISIFCILSKLH